MSKRILDQSLGAAPRRDRLAQLGLTLFGNAYHAHAEVVGIGSVGHKAKHFQWLKVAIKGRGMHPDAIGESADRQTLLTAHAGPEKFCK